MHSNLVVEFLKSNVISIKSRVFFSKSRGVCNVCSFAHAAASVWFCACQLCAFGLVIFLRFCYFYIGGFYTAFVRRQPCDVRLPSQMTHAQLR